MKFLFKKINENKFKIFGSSAIKLDRRVHDPNFTQQEKKELRTIFRLLLNEYLLDHFKWQPEKEVREVIGKIPHRIFIDRRLKLETYVGKYYLPLMKKSPKFKYLIEQTDLRTLPDKTVSELLQLEVPINKHPVFHVQDGVEEMPPTVSTDANSDDEGTDNVDTDQPAPSPDNSNTDANQTSEIPKPITSSKFNQEVAAFLKLSKSKKKEFIAKKIRIDEVNRITARQLIKEDILTQNQAKKLLWISDMARLTGNNILFIKALSEKKIKSLKDLIGWDVQEWVEFVEKRKIPLPDTEKTSTSYAKNILKNLKCTFPTQFLGYRNKKINVQGHVQKIDAVTKLQKNNKEVLGRRKFDADKLDWKGINQTERKILEASLTSTQEFANSFSGLGIRDIINDNKKPLINRKKLIEERLNAYGKFQENNPNLDLGKVDFLKGKDFLNWGGIKEEHILPIKKQGMAMQRLQQLSEDPETTEVLLKTGFDSAMSIASMPEDKFYGQSGLAYEESRLVYNKAKDISRVTSHYFEAVRDSVQGSFLKLGVNNQKNLVNDLKDIDGFDDLFGNQNYCGCEHCRSIFGAAAYFTDLMYFIQENVSDKHFEPLETDHPLYLKNRRPDLWELKLTCENTNTELPYLQIVIEVLESFIGRNEGIEDAYKYVHEAAYYTLLPLHIPLKELRVYLGYYSISLEGIYRQLGAARSQILRETINLSKEEVEIISTKAPDKTHIKFASQPLNQLWVQPFIKVLDISRRQLDELLATRFIPDLEKISVKKIEFEDDIQSFREQLTGMTKTLLDALYRYYLLWKKTDWTIPEFDLIMRAFKRQGLIPNLVGQIEPGFPYFLRLARAIEWQNELNLTIEQLTSVIDSIPTISIKEGQAPYYNRVFDLEALFGIASTDADGVVTYNDTFILPVDKSTDVKTSFILAGLSITEAELSQMLILLELNIEEDLIIEHGKLSKLYKNTRLSKNMGLSIEEYVGLCDLLFENKQPEGIEEINEIIRFNAWLNETDFNVSQLLFLLEGKQTTQQSYTITYENLESEVFKFHEDYYSLVSEDSASETTNDQDIKEFTRDALHLYLEDKYEMTGDQLQIFALSYFGSEDAIENALARIDDAEFIEESDDDFVEEGKVKDMAVFDDLIEIEQRLERHSLMLQLLDLDFGQFEFIIENPIVFNIDDVSVLKHSDIKQLTKYQSLVIDLQDKTEFQKILVNYDSESEPPKLNEEDLILLSELWQTDKSILKSILESFPHSNIAISAIYELKKTFDLADLLGVQGQSLQKLLLDDYEDIKVARDLILGSIKSKYEEESEKEEALSSYLSTIRTIKRDALCDAIIGNKAVYKFSDRIDLYNFFLLDVDMSGCFMTSRIVCANSSLQQYINRCLINLEQSDESLNPEIEDIKVSPNDIPEEEWAWRKNYRVWEANRKVFLYPENYIDPALRDTKTHIFKELEDELLQKDITLDSAEEAYKNYMAKFTELTRLRYAGAYYESKANDYGYMPISLGDKSAFIRLSGTRFIREASESLYYLFARTNTDPYQYYYRTYHHPTNTWGNWIKMNVAIEADEISSLIFNGKLYVFWNSAVSKEVSKFDGGTNKKIGYDFKLYSNYCYKKEDGTWTTPQKVYLGFLSDSEMNIYSRLGEPYYIDEDDRDKKNEHVLHEYIKRVFKKPYASINTKNSEVSINIRCLFTNNGMGVIENDYHIPPSTFPINSDFTVFMLRTSFATIGETVPIDLNVQINSVYYKVKDGNIQGTATLGSASYVLIEIDKEIILESKSSNFMIPYELKVAFSVNVVNDNEVLNIRKKLFKLSLSKNDIIDHEPLKNILDSDYSSELDETNFLKKEFDAAFSEVGLFNHYVEDGTNTFTNKNNTIIQYTDGLATLNIPNDLGSLDSKSLNTILTDELTDTLYNYGIEEFLSLQNQNATDNVGQTFDMKGSYGEYYWELFFHIPFLIASHLNANQKFKEAKWWYERIFNPTNNEDPNNPDSMDHLWQFREFQNLDQAKLEDILTDTNAIEAYKNDPFDPHAIARLRISAYQKTIVMKYIDNLLDWADYLFTQDTRESVMEALQYYQLAYSMLGKRPVQIGDCESPNFDILTYERIKDRIEEGSEFLITLENSYINILKGYFNNTLKVQQSKHLSSCLQNNGFKEPPTSLSKVKENVQFQSLPKVTELHNNAPHIASEQSVRPPKVTNSFDVETGKDGVRINKYDDLVEHKLDFNYQFKKEWKDGDVLTREKVVEPIPRRENSFQLVKESVLVFCVPENSDLMAYWDRVEDRLFKIRNCMNIEGVVRSLSLFAPPIDPNMLVRATASGLSLEAAIQAALSNDIPNYRFTYLVDKARQYVQTAQSFGAALLSAMEKKDVEELTQLRSVHEQNILKLSLDIKKKQLEEANHNYNSLNETLANIQYKHEYFDTLISNGLNSFEAGQQQNSSAAFPFMTYQHYYSLLSSLNHLLPQLGAPTAMTWGGKQLGENLDKASRGFGSIAGFLNSLSQAMEVTARFDRREEDWNYQKSSAENEIKSVEQQILASEIKKAIAEKDIAIQEATIENASEIYDFYKNKFTQMGLYNHLCTQLNRLYREAYNVALSMAKSAEKAYQIETFDDTFHIANDNWETDKAGLLSGDRLLLQLQQMEQAYIEKNARRPEIRQTFSLALLDSEALLKLKQNAHCEFTIPELAFELLYPGQYRRVIKGATITIPCVTGPYTNISAKLTFNGGIMKKEQGPDAIVDPYEIAKGASISVSNGLNDSGVFEFNFRDERYLPFEGGAAADSKWTLDLPNKFRAFDYNTISDVLITLNYTALEGNRIQAETELATQIINNSAHSGLFRIISLKHEFPNEWHQAVSNEENNTLDIALMDNHFPYFTREYEIDIFEYELHKLNPKESIENENHPTNVVPTSSESTVSKNNDVFTIEINSDELNDELFLVLKYRLNEL